MGLELKEQKHWAKCWKWTQHWNHSFYKVWNKKKGKRKNKKWKRRVNNRQWDWRWRSKIIEWNAESEHSFDIIESKMWERKIIGKIKKKAKEEWMTGNEIGVEGAKSMSEMLKVNTTLKSLKLSGEERRKKEKRNKKRWMNDRQWDWRWRKEDTEGCMGPTWWRA